MWDFWISDSSPGHTEQFKEQLLHLQVRAVAWRFGGCSWRKQNVQVVVHSGLLQLRKSVTSNCLTVGMLVDVVLADSLLFVPDGWLDMILSSSFGNCW